MAQDRNLKVGQRVREGEGRCESGVFLRKIGASAEVLTVIQQHGTRTPCAGGICASTGVAHPHGQGDLVSTLRFPAELDSKDVCRVRTCNLHVHCRTKHCMRLLGVPCCISLDQWHRS